MTDLDRLDQRLTAVERTVIDGEFDLEEVADRAALADELDHLESRVEEFERRLADVEGRTASIGGFVGRVETVNETVERDAATARAVVDRLERRVDELERRLEVESQATEHEIEPPDTDTASTADGGEGTDRRSRKVDGDPIEEEIDELVAGPDEGPDSTPTATGTSSASTVSSMPESDAERAVFDERSADHTLKTTGADPATQRTVERRVASTDSDATDENAPERAADSDRSTGLFGSIRSVFR